MDAQAYLIRHGWSGPGNPLNPNRVSARGGLGLTKPILVARRSGNQGVGKQTTKDPTNQWWLRGFEDALKGVGQDNNGGAGTGKSAPNALTSELYRFFVRGEVVPGTLETGSKRGESEEKKKTKRKRDSGDDQEQDGETRKKKKERKEKESKEERRKRKEEKRRIREEKKQTESSAGVENEKKTRRKEHKVEDDYPTPMSMEEFGERDTESRSLYKEIERRTKKEKKERKREKESDPKGSKKSKKREASTSDDGSKSKSKKSKDGKRST